jgi:hypothetical protein
MGFFTSNHFGAAAFDSNYFGGQNASNPPGSTGPLQIGQGRKRKRWIAPEEKKGHLSTTLDGAALAVTGENVAPVIAGELLSVLDGLEFSAVGLVEIPHISGCLKVSLSGAVLSAPMSATAPPPPWEQREQVDATLLLLLA